MPWIKKNEDEEGDTWRTLELRVNPDPMRPSRYKQVPKDVWDKLLAGEQAWDRLQAEMEAV